VRGGWNVSAAGGARATAPVALMGSDRRAGRAFAAGKGDGDVYGEGNGLKLLQGQGSGTIIHICVAGLARVMGSRRQSNPASL
jgi:hypothetical protein